MADGSVTETFACGTAAVITPVGEVKGAPPVTSTVGDGSPGPLTMRLRESLLDIQHGRVADTARLAAPGLLTGIPVDRAALAWARGHPG